METKLPRMQNVKLVCDSRGSSIESSVRQCLICLDLLSSYCKLIDAFRLLLFVFRWCHSHLSWLFQTQSLVKQLDTACQAFGIIISSKKKKTNNTLRCSCARTAALFSSLPTNSAPAASIIIRKRSLAFSLAAVLNSCQEYTY